MRIRDRIRDCLSLNFTVYTMQVNDATEMDENAVHTSCTKQISYQQGVQTNTPLQLCHTALSCSLCNHAVNSSILENYCKCSYNYKLSFVFYNFANKIMLCFILVINSRKWLNTTLLNSTPRLRRLITMHLHLCI